MNRILRALPDISAACAALLITCAVEGRQEALERHNLMGFFVIAGVASTVAAAAARSHANGRMTAEAQHAYQDIMRMFALSGGIIMTWQAARALGPKALQWQKSA